MGVPLSHPAVQQAIERGLIRLEDLLPRLGVATAPGLTPVQPAPDPEPTNLVAAAHQHGTTVWVIGVAVPSLANGRDWRQRNRVAQAHRRPVSRALGAALADLTPIAERLHRGGAIRVHLVRLGGRQLDRHDNLPTALKYVLDGVCVMLGVDDADERLDVKYSQEVGGASGARIELA